MSTIVNTKLSNPVQLTSGSVATIYTVPASRTVIISSLAIANNEDQMRHLSVHLCPAGASALENNILLPFVEIPANSLINIGIGQTIVATDVVRAVSDGDHIIIHSSGMVIT